MHMEAESSELHDTFQPFVVREREGELVRERGVSERGGGGVSEREGGGVSEREGGGGISVLCTRPLPLRSSSVKKKKVRKKSPCSMQLDCLGSTELTSTPTPTPTPAPAIGGRSKRHALQQQQHAARSTQHAAWYSTYSTQCH
jgi:hypothetical protein